MADGSMIQANSRVAVQGQNGQKHYIMGYIAAIWANFGAGKSPDQKRQMIAVWEQSLADIPVQLQKAAIDKKVREGQVFPPSSPAELRRWCSTVCQPMTRIDAEMYRTALEEGLLDADFCRMRLAQYEASKASGREAYAKYDF